jgi:DNA-binding winged helix-turn-helix (wHTH) protein
MTSVPRRLYEFGEFRLDPAERLLTRHDQPVELPPKAFDVLVFLVERHGRLVRKDEFLQELWPGTFVEEGTLKRHISALRKALGQNGGEDRYIETLPKAGYRFAAPVRTIERETLIPDAPRSEPEPRRLSVRRGTKWALTAAAIAIVGAVSTILLRTSAPASANADPGVADFPKRLTDNLGSDDFPDWSPDGKRIVFMSAREGKPDIYVMNADGTGLINLTANPASDACPSWSPDGRQIVFESDRPPGQGIYVMDADGRRGRPTGSALRS